MLIVAASHGSIFDPLYHVMGIVLAWLYGIVPSYGVAIILLTVAVRLVLFPLTTKQARSMQEMQRVQPEMKRLQAKYKNDRQKLNEEMMKLYKEHNINPLAGCLPLLLQMPLFIVLYRLIEDLSPRPRHKPSVAQLKQCIDQAKAAIDWHTCVHRPKHIPATSHLYHALIKSGGKMVSWGIDLAERARSVHGFGNAWPFYVLVVLTVVTGYYQQRQMTARTPASAQNAQTQMMGRIFPLFFGLISLSIPAGVVVYFIASNTWQIGQQAWIFRQMDAAGSGPAPAKAAPAAPAVQPDPTPPAKANPSGAARNRRRRKRRGR